ncbi:MAG: hypothetical protein NVS2B12_34750 [Ktedonobacteraceae bacterium]
MHADKSLPIGQLEARTRWGTHESGAAFDRKKSFFLTEKAQDFLAQQAFFVIAGRGTGNELDAQLVMEKPGFVEIIDQQTCLLHLNGQLRNSSLFQELRHASAVGLSNQFGLFFLCHSTRERLCLHGNAQLLPRKKSSFFKPLKQGGSMCIRLKVQQAFFHCPKYIRTRVPGLTTSVTPSTAQIWHPQHLLSGNQEHLTEEMRAFLAQQVLCFLCTVSKDGQCAVNHRGGAPGFLLTLPPTAAAPGGMVFLPDYAGNGAFEAFGNILETGLATVLVPHYAAQLALCIIGTARVYELGELPAWLVQKCPGAERVMALSVQHIGVQFGDWSTTLAYERRRAESFEASANSALKCPV